MSYNEFTACNTCECDMCYNRKGCGYCDKCFNGSNYSCDCRQPETNHDYNEEESI